MRNNSWRIFERAMEDLGVTGKVTRDFSRHETIEVTLPSGKTFLWPISNSVRMGRSAGRELDNAVTSFKRRIRAEIAGESRLRTASRLGLDPNRGKG